MSASAQSARPDQSPRRQRPPAAPAPRGRSVQARDAIESAGIYIALLALIVALWIASPYFLSVQNVLNIGQAVAVIGIVAAGLTVALIGGQLDLSVGSVIGLTSVIIALLVRDAGVALGVAIAAAFGVALLVGSINALVVVKFGINSIITTLATLTVTFGLAMILAKGQTISLPHASFQEFVFARPLGVPVPIIMMLVIYVLVAVFLYRTRLGWHVYAVGGNATAAERAGVRTSGLYWLIFVQSAVFACLGGVITAGQTAAGAAQYGTGLELDVLTAVLIGGIGLGGGAGRIERTLAGVLIIGVLANGLILLNVESYFQEVIRGLALLLAVILDATRAKRMRR
jgi:ribose transport system permease protein